MRQKKPTQMQTIVNLITTAMQLYVGVRIIDILTRPDRTLKGMMERLNDIESKMITLHIKITDEVIRP